MAKLDLRKNKYGRARFLEQISMTSVDFLLKIGMIYLIKLENLTKLVFFLIFWTNFSFKTRNMRFFFEKSKNG